MSCRSSSKRGFPSRCSTFLLVPVKKLSTQRTSCPAATRRSHKCEPSKPAPPGVPVGPHLAALAVFFPGYSVTATGALVGGAYASVVGGIAGFLLAIFWNAAHALFLAVIRMRASLASYSID